MEVRAGVQKRICCIALVVLAVSLPQVDAMATTTTTEIQNPDAYICPQSGFIDFEDLADRTDLTRTAIKGVKFTTTDGFTWQVGDFSTGSYNGKFPNGAYTSKGTHWAWLGASQSRGRIDFPRGRVSFFSSLVSSGSAVVLEAYDRSGRLLETAGPAPTNTSTGRMHELRIVRSTADIDHIIVHDSGNFFLIDAICTDARGIPATDRPSAYAALGDSYASGEGLGPFEQGTNEALVNECRRSRLNSYGTRVLQGTTRSFRACSGAVIDDFYHVRGYVRDPGADDGRPFSGEQPQLYWLGPQTKYVTLSIGGNDVGFAQVLDTCAVKPGQPVPGKNDISSACQGAVTQANNLISGLRPRLERLYMDIITRAPTARILVLNYPALFPRSFQGYKDQGEACVLSGHWGNKAFFSKKVVDSLRTSNSQLNSEIRAAVESVRRQGAFRLRLANVEAEFGNHTISCGDNDSGVPKPWINAARVNSSLGVSTASFHPNATGQCNMAVLVNREFAFAPTKEIVCR